MMKKILLLILVLVFFFGCGQKREIEEKISTTYLNLDFEDSVPKESPKFWFTGGMGYQVVLDREDLYSGKASLYMESIEEKSTGRHFGVATSTFPVDDARGKKLRYSGYIKTENVAGGYAGLWWRVDGEKGGAGALAFDNMMDRGVSGTQPWKEYVVELDIPAEAKNINFGVLLTGTGKAWFDHLRIALDGIPYKQVKPKPIVPRKVDLAWIRANSIPFKSADHYSDHEELLALKEMIGSRRIVALGEGTHGTAEFFKMKHRLTRFLAEEMGFTVFAIEANMPEARKVNRYVLTGEGDPKEALAGLYFWTWNTAEVLDMIEWMREYNRSGKGRIEFYGFDMQFPQVTMESVTEFVKKADPGFVRSLGEHYRQIEKMQQEFYKSRGDYSKVDFKKWHAEAQKAYDHIKAKREIYLKTFAAGEVEWALQDANMVVQNAEIFIEGQRSRDQSMAENLVWILEHKPAGTKVVTWAHNLHVSKQPWAFESMGCYLDKKYGGDMIVFGFAFHEGEYTAVGKNGINTYTTSPSEPGSVEWFLKKSGIPNLILDIRNISIGEPGSEWLARELDFRNIGAMAADYAFKKQEIAKEFDALIFFEKTTASDCFRKKSREKKKEDEP